MYGFNNSGNTLCLIFSKWYTVGFVVRVSGSDIFQLKLCIQRMHTLLFVFMLLGTSIYYFNLKQSLNIKFVKNFIFLKVLCTEDLSSLEMLLFEHDGHYLASIVSNCGNTFFLWNVFFGESE